MRALIYQGLVVQVAQQDFEVSPTMFWVGCPDNCVPGWTYNGSGVVPPVVPPKTPDEILTEYNGLMQEYMDEVAGQKNYNSALHCASYYDSTVESWKNEAGVFIAWRDAVWVYAYAELAKFLSGERPLIPFSEFVTELPVIAWPV